MNVLRAIYRYWAALLFVGVLVQIGFAGYGAFFASTALKHKGDTSATMRSTTPGASTSAGDTSSSTRP